MAIRRAREQSEFLTLHNTVVEDRRLSYVALGLLTEFLHYPPDWRIGSIKELAAAKRGSLRHDGRDVIGTAMRELEGAGYLTREKTQDPATGRWTTDTVVWSRPQVDPAEAVKPQVSPGPGFPGPGEPGPGYPGPGKAGPIPKTLPKDTPKDEPPPPPPAHRDRAAPPVAGAQEVEASTPPPTHPVPVAAGYGPTSGDVVLDAVLARAGVTPLARPTGVRWSTLAARLETAVDAGWSPDRLAAALGTEPLTGVRSVFAVLGSRITDLGPPPPAAPIIPTRPAPDRETLIAGCDRCDRHGYLEAGDVCDHTPDLVTA